MENVTVAFKGKSMGRLLQEGDQLTVNLFNEPRPLEKADLGKIVLSRAEREWILHRVVKLNNKLVIKGDHSLVVDEFVEGKIWGELNSFNSSIFFSKLSALYVRSTPRPFRYFIRRLILLWGQISRNLTRRKSEEDLYFELLRGEKPLLEFGQFQKIKDLAQMHFLAPYLYQKLHRDNIENFNEWKDKQKILSLKETLVLFELEALRENLPENIQPIVLKGASLINRVYKKPGLRFMSDIDLLLIPAEKKVTENVLRNMGYERVTEDHGPANRCKSMWTKPMFDSELVIELHEKINWFQSPDVQWRLTPSLIIGYNQLDLTDELIYLSIHLSFSHNFQRLFWLVDLYELIKQNEAKINWECVRTRARELNAEKAVTAILIALKKTHKLEVKMWDGKSYPSLKLLITRGFLLNPYGSIIRFVLLKHLLQDKLVNAFKYDYYRLQISLNKYS